MVRNTPVEPVETEPVIVRNTPVEPVETEPVVTRGQGARPRSHSSTVD